MTSLLQGKTGKLVKIMQRFYLFLGICLLATVASHAQAGIHQVDFKNFTYMPYCAGEESQKVTVRNGEYSSEKQMDGYVDRFYFNVVSVAFGDLNGDKKDEAVVLSVCNTGGTGQFSEGFVFTMKAGKPSLWMRIPGGDRADGGLRSATVENGLLVVDANDNSENGGACCPEFAVKTKYRLSGDKMTEIGTPIRRELYPKERISFAKGSSGKTFTVKIPAAYLKRFTLGARAGQTLSVSVSSEKASLRLLDDADVTEAANKFFARLPKNGDYTFEVANYGDTEIEITVTIKIQ